MIKKKESSNKKQHWNLDKRWKAIFSVCWKTFRKKDIIFVGMAGSENTLGFKSSSEAPPSELNPKTFLWGSTVGLTTVFILTVQRPIQINSPCVRQWDNNPIKTLIKDVVWLADQNYFTDK